MSLKEITEKHVLKKCSTLHYRQIVKTRNRKVKVNELSD